MNETSQVAVAGEAKPQSMLYERCIVCDGRGCTHCKVIGVMETGATALQLESLAKLDTLRQESGISAAMLRDGRARQMVDLFQSKGSKAMDDECALKVEVNNFVWMHAPGAMPLAEADDFACAILEMFLDARKKYHTPTE